MNASPESSSPDLSHIEPPLQALAIPVGEVLPDPANARTHDGRNLDVIKGSLKGFRQQKPIVLDADGICLAGNGTLQAALALGWSHIAAVRSTLRGAQARAYSIADNRATDTSQWDQAVLVQHLEALQADDMVDALLTGFDEQAVAELLKQAGDADDPPADLSDKEVAIQDTFSLLVTCRDEAQQRELFERLTGEGFSCRVLTL